MPLNIDPRDAYDQSVEQDDAIEIEGLDLEAIESVGCDFTVKPFQHEAPTDDGINSYMAYKPNFEQYEALTQNNGNGAEWESIQEFVSDFDVFRAKNPEDLTGDKGVLKLKVKTSNNGPTFSETDGAAIIHYSFYLECNDEPFDSSIFRKKPEIHRKCRMFQGLDIGLGTMRVGDKCIFLIAPEYAYKEIGCLDRIPANASILADVSCLQLISKDELLDSLSMTEDEMKELSFSKAHDLCTSACTTGKGHIRAGNYTEACKPFLFSIKILENVHGETEEEYAKHDSLLTRLRLNLALCQLQQRKYKNCIKNCSDVLRMSNQAKEFQTKALYRMAMAYNGLGDINKADQSVKRAHSLSPNDSLIKDLMMDIGRMVEAEREKERQLCQRMMTATISDVTDEEASKALWEPKPCSDEFCQLIDGKLAEFISSDEQELVLPYKFKSEENVYLGARIKGLGLGVKYDSGAGVRVTIYKSK